MLHSNVKKVKVLKRDKRREGGGSHGFFGEWDKTTATSRGANRERERVRGRGWGGYTPKIIVRNSFERRVVLQ